MHNRGLTIWLDHLKDVFHDAMDLLDEFECEDLRRQVVKTQGSTSRKVRRFFSSSNPIAFHNKIGHRVKDIRERFNLIAKDKDQFHLEVRLDDKDVKESNTIRERRKQRATEQER